MSLTRCKCNWKLVWQYFLFLSIQINNNFHCPVQDLFCVLVFYFFFRLRCSGCAGGLRFQVCGVKVQVLSSRVELMASETKTDQTTNRSFIHPFITLLPLLQTCAWKKRWPQKNGIKRKVVEYGVGIHYRNASRGLKNLIIKAEIVTWSEHFIKSNPLVPVDFVSVYFL